MNDLRKAAEMVLEAFMAWETLEDVEQAHGSHSEWFKEPLKALRQALAEPEQEPVAVWELEEDGWNTIADPDWMETLPVGTRLYTAPVDAVNISAERVDETAKREQEPVVKWDASAPLVITQHPAFQQPAQREWVGLTDEEREQATGWSVEHIEAKLKEKNGG